MSDDAPLSVALVDPSLFTAPYDAALSKGLAEAGVEVRWATRAPRPGEEDLLNQSGTAPTFYRLTDGPNRREGSGWRVIKGVEHVFGLNRLLRMAARGEVDLVHFQWSVLPRLDLWAIRQLRRYVPVAVTVHDTTPFNGKAVSRAQTSGYAALLGAVDLVIVHTAQGAGALAALGVDPGRIAVVPHGLMPGTDAGRIPTKRDRWHFVQFGKIQHYKGVDILVEALGLIGAHDRQRLKVTIAGEPLIDLAPVGTRATALGLGDTLEWRPFRHDISAMDTLLASADTFVFPYRAIEASGVLFQVASLGRWVVASDLGAFRELVGHAGDAGTLVPPGEPRALADALLASVNRVPTRLLAADVPDWTRIGTLTREAYGRARSDWARTRRAA